MPSHAAVRSSCSALRKRSRRGAVIGSTASTAKRRRSLSHASTTSSPMAPAIDVSRSRPTEVQRNQGPTWSSVSARTRTISCPGSSGSISTMMRPSSRRSSTHARQQRDRVAADADVAVEQQRGPPAASAGNAVEHRSLEHVHAASARHVEERRRRCRCRARRRCVRRAPRGAGRDRTRCRAPALRRGRARAARRRSRPRTSGARAGRARVRRRCRGAPVSATTVMRRHACRRAPRRSASGGSSARPRCASANVSTSRSSVEVGDGAVRALGAVRAADGRCAAVDISTPSNKPGSGRAHADRPVPAVTRGPEHRVDARARAAAPTHASSSAGVIWGVSIPTTSTGPSTATTAASSRSPRPPCDCGTTSQPGGTQGPGCAVEREHPAVAARCRRPRRGCRRAPPRPARPPARACTEGRGGS